MATELKFGLISVNDHVHETPDLWTSRLPREPWGDRIPHIERQADNHDAWVIDGVVLPLSGGATCGAALDDRSMTPGRWADVPRSYYDARARLTSMDKDGVDYAVLYPSASGVAGENLIRISDPDLQVACVQAYNDWLIDEWAVVSPRFVPQCLVPLTSIDAAIAEVKRATGRGHKGVILPSIPAMVSALPHINDAAWDPLWAAIAEAGVPLCFHAGSPGPIQIEPDARLSPRLADAFRAITRPASHIPVMVNFLISRILLRHPDLRVVFAESALGWAAYLLEFTDHQFREDGVARSGEYPLTPSEMFKRQCYLTGWYDRTGVRTRHHIGVENIMWSTNFPLTTSTWPDTKDFVARGLEGVPDNERQRILWENAAQLYNL